MFDDQHRRNLYYAEMGRICETVVLDARWFFGPAGLAVWVKAMTEVTRPIILAPMRRLEYVPASRLPQN